MITNGIHRISTISKNILIAGAVFVAAIILAALWLFQVHAQSISYASGAVSAQNTSTGTVYLSAKEETKAKTAPAAAKGPVQEMNIASNGFTLVRGARVVSIEGTRIQVRVAWGATDFTWGIDIDSGTKLFAPNGEKESVADIRVGDVITASGQLAQVSGDPVINADFVRESR